MSEIAIEQPAGSVVADGGSVGFGMTTLTAPLDRTFTVRNLGNAVLTGLDTTIDGPNANQFAVVANPSSPVAPGDNTTFTVRFAPTSGGAKSAVLHVASNDADENPYDIALSGSAAPAPTATALPPAVATKTTAVLHGVADSGGIETNVRFEYGTTPAFGSMTPDQPFASGVAFFRDSLSGLAPATTYYTRVVATNASGTTLSATRTFTTRDDDVVVRSWHRFGEIDDTGGPNAADSIGDRHIAHFRPFAAIVAPGAAARVQSTTSLNFETGFSSGAPAHGGVTDDFALEAWVNPRTVSFDRVIVYNGNPGSNGWGIIRQGTTYRALFGGLELFGAGFATFLDWNHVALVRTGGTTTLYVDGVASGTSQTVPNPPTLQLFIEPGQFIDEARVLTFPPGGFGIDDLLFPFANVGVTKTNNEGGLLPGRDTVYAIRATNAGPTAVSGVRVVDSVPPELLDPQWTCASTPPALCPAPSGNGSIDQTVAATMDPGAFVEYTLVATPSGTAGAFITNTATATEQDALVRETSSADNSASDTDPIVGDGIFTNGFEN